MLIELVGCGNMPFPAISGICSVQYGSSAPCARIWFKYTDSSNVNRLS